MPPNKTKCKRQRSNDGNRKRARRQSAVATDSCDVTGVLLGTRVLKKFPYTTSRGRVIDALYLGTVSDYRPCRADRSLNQLPGNKRLDRGLYRVVFDDGDVDDMNPEEVIMCAVKCYKQRSLRREKGPKRKLMLIIGSTSDLTQKESEAQGLASLLNTENPALSDEQIKILDAERMGYWAEFKEFNINNGMKKPGSLLGVRDKYWWDVVPVAVSKPEPSDQGGNAETTEPMVETTEPTVPTDSANGSTLGDPPVVSSDAKGGIAEDSKHVEASGLSLDAKVAADEGGVHTSQPEVQTNLLSESGEIVPSKDTDNPNKPDAAEPISGAFIDVPQEAKRVLPHARGDGQKESCSNDHVVQTGSAGNVELANGGVESMDVEGGKDNSGVNKAMISADSGGICNPADTDKGDRDKKKEHEARPTTADSKLADTQHASSEKREDMENVRVPDDMVPPHSVGKSSRAGFAVAVDENGEVEEIGIGTNDRVTVKDSVVDSKVAGAGIAPSVAKGGANEKDADSKEPAIPSSSAIASQRAGAASSDMKSDSAPPVNDIVLMVSQKKARHHSTGSDSLNGSDIDALSENAFDHTTQKLIQEEEPQREVAKTSSEIRETKSKQDTPEEHRKLHDESRRDESEAVMKETQPVKQLVTLQGSETPSEAGDESKKTAAKGKAPRKRKSCRNRGHGSKKAAATVIPSDNNEPAENPSRSSNRCVSVGHPHADIREGSGVYSRQKLYYLGAHRADMSPVSGTPAAGCDSILLHRSSERPKRKEDFGMFKYMCSRRNGGGALYVSYIKNSPIRVFHKLENLPPPGDGYVYDGLYFIIAMLDEHGSPRDEFPNGSDSIFQFLMKRCLASPIPSPSPHLNSLAIDELWEKVKPVVRDGEMEEGEVEESEKPMDHVAVSAEPLRGRGSNAVGARSRQRWQPVAVTTEEE